MGIVNLPKVFVDAPSETPDAKKFNDNFSFLNMAQDQHILNGDFEKFTGGTPDNWVLSGAGAISASDADSIHGPLAVLLTFGSAPAVLKQETAVVNFFQGRKVKAWCFVKTSTVAQARIRINDGIATSDSVFHSGGGTYELLIVEHDMAVGATEFSLEMRVESGGAALFDAAVMVDFSTQLSFFRNPADLAEATKEFFYIIPEAEHGVGNWATESIASSGDTNLSLLIPRDFTSLVSAVLVCIPAATSGPQTVELRAHVAAPGEDATATENTDLANTFTYVANQLTEFDISSIFTGLSAGDYMGVDINRISNGFGNLEVLGIRLRYN